MILAKLLRLAALLMGLALAACAGAPPGGPPPAGEAEVAALAQAIRGLGPGVDGEEAARAARIAYAYPRRLAAAYGVTDPPLIHNMKVNMGLRPRGLCWQWADDLEARLAEEDFRTLALHRAIANADAPFRIDHSTVIVSRRGDGLFDGLVLDPWRAGGALRWAPVGADDYDWRPRESVFAERRRGRAGAAPRPALAGPS